MCVKTGNPHILVINIIINNITLEDTLEREKQNFKEECGIPGKGVLPES